MFLALTPHPQFWEFRNNSIVLLGEWCINDKTKPVLEGKNYSIVTSPWKDKRIYESVPYCFELMKFWMPHFTKILNEAHRVEKSERYWKVLLSCWLYDYISILYDKYLRIEKAIEESGDIETYFLNENAFIPILNLENQWALLTGDDFHLQIFSIIGREMGLNVKTVILPKKELGLHNDLSIQTQLKRKLKSLIMRGITKILRNLNPFLKKEVILEGISTECKFILSQVSGQNLLYSIPNIHFDLLTNQNGNSLSKNLDRDVFKKLPSRNRFEEIARKAIKIGFPHFYFEKYKNIIEVVSPYIQKREKLVIAINSWYADEPFKFIAAEIADRGGRLIRLQHGGAFGATMDMASELVERYITDVLVGSGWSEKEDTKREICEVIPLPIPKYSKIKNSHRYKTDRCIFVGNMIPRYVYRIQTFLIPEEMEEYFHWKYIFFKKLREDILKRFCYRPFFGDYGWNEIGRIKKEFPEMNIFKGGNLLREMKKCKLVISDHLATSYLESLITNTPTVLYWDKEIFKIRPSANKYFDLLRDVKILHDGPISAAGHINEIFDDVNKWWGNESVQNVRMQFVNYMGLSSKNWVYEWSNFIKEQLELRK